MKTRNKIVVWLLVSGLTVCAWQALAEDVFVRATESGRGFTRLLGAECFVVAPAHVVMGRNNSEDIQRVTVVGRQGRKAEAKLEGKYGDDLAILRIVAADARSAFCNPSNAISPLNPSKVVSEANGAIELRLREEDGGMLILPVMVKSDDQRRYFYILPVRSNDIIGKTMSGSVLYAGGVAVGMLMEVDTQTGKGEVHRQNYVEDGVRAFFVELKDLPWLKVERIGVPLDARGEEMLKLAETVLDLIQHGGDLEVYDRYLSPGTRKWMTREFFHQYVNTSYGPLAGLPVKRKLAQYILPSTTGVPRRWLLLIDAQAEDSRFQEALSFEQTDGGWRLANLTISPSM